MNIFEALRESHDNQRALSEQLIQTHGHTELREQLFQALKNELWAHSVAEDRYLYIPLMFNDIGLDISRHALSEHHEMDELVGPLSIALYYARQKYDLIWVCCAIVGLLLLFPFHQASHHLDLIGIAYALAAGACWALYIIAGQKPSGISGNHTVFLGMTIGALLLIPIAFLTGSMAHVFELPYIFYFIALAILASALPFSLEMLALRRLTALSFGTLMSMEPAVAAFSGFIFLGEKLIWSQWLALATIITASVGCTVTTQRAKRTDHVVP